MDKEDERIREAIEQTKILRHPKQKLYTFGTTTINYYLLTEPAYVELMAGTPETVIREGKVTAERPKIVTPYYLTRLEGFSPEARRYFSALMAQFGPDTQGLFYTYRNEPKDSTIVSEDLRQIANKLNAEIDQRSDPLTAIIKGEDTLWDVSLMKFIYEITSSSVPENLTQMGRRGLLGMDSAGIPADARAHIEELFRQVERGECEPGRLKEELERWNIFDEYQDRFLGIFRKRK